jgi:hypothetical protein
METFAFSNGRSNDFFYKAVPGTTLWAASHISRRNLPALLTDILGVVFAHTDIITRVKNNEARLYPALRYKISIVIP